MTPPDKISDEELEQCGETFIHNGVEYFVGWMNMGSYSMWYNEQPNGGFKWEFTDFKEDDLLSAKIYISAIDPRAAQSSKPEWPSEDEIREARLWLCKCDEETGFDKGVEWIKKVMGVV